MKFNFDFNVDTRGEVSVSISKQGIIFNKKTINILNRPAAINIGIDYQNKVMGIQRAENSTKGLKTFNFVKKDNQNWIRITSIALIREIERLTQIKFTKDPISFKTTYDEELKMLIVDLKGE